jgi:glutathione S-transferase
LSQSNAILRHIAAKHNLIGATEHEQAVCYQMQDVAMDLRNGNKPNHFSRRKSLLVVAMVRVFYGGSNFKELKESFLTGYLPCMLDRLEAMLKKNSWFCGTSLTFVDFIFFELLDQLQRFDAPTLMQYPALGAFCMKFESISPQVQAYINSPKHTKLPINNKQASFA